MYVDVPEKFDMLIPATSLGMGHCRIHPVILFVKNQ
jgi:hypothetical protein